MNAPASLFRERGGAAGERVYFAELFFDLVFVFAVTQVSHTLVEDMTGGGLLRMLLLLLALWWVWIYTSWVTNWLAPERIPVRLCLFVMMLAGFLLAVAIPEAFGGLGLVFALGYAFMQVGRTAFMLWASRRSTREMRCNFLRILVWFLVSAVFWVIGGASEAHRMGWWMVALAVELAGPFALFRVPGLGASDTRQWNISGAHMVERCGLFIIVALGESLLVTGATFLDLGWNGRNLYALFLAAIATMLMWWLYFDTGIHRGHHNIVHTDDPGRLARIAYTYLHVIIVAGILLSAVGDEIVMADGAHGGHGEGEHGGSIQWMIVLAGPAVFLVGSALFKWVTNARKAPPLSHLAGIAMTALLAWPAATHAVSLLGLGTLATAVLLLVAVWESIALRRGPAAFHPEH